MKAVIVSNGKIEDYSYFNIFFESANLIISVDGGAAHMRKFGQIPHIMLGDFDSINSEDFNYFKDKSVEIIKFLPEKDMTDTELAVEIAIQRGCREIIFIGGVGTRLDHSLANIFMLKELLEQGISGRIIDEYNEIVLIKDKIVLKKEEQIKISLLPLSEKVTGVTTKGLYYPLKDATLKMGYSRGVSNEFDSDVAEVSIKEGYLMVIKSRD